MENERQTFLIWGNVGTGKTPLSITAPAPILYMKFDYDGDKSVLHRADRYEVVDFTKLPMDAIDMLALGTRFMSDLDAALAGGQFKSVVVDSITSVAERALLRGIVRVAPMITKGTKPSELAPGMQGYGARGTLTRNAVMALHQVTAKHNVNLVLTGHQKLPDMASDGTITGITLMLGGETWIQVPKNISEIWLMREVEINGKLKRMFYLRPWNRYEPMRSRMFDTRAQLMFEWKYDNITGEGEGLEDWINQWRVNGCLPIPMPK